VRSQRPAGRCLGILPGKSRGLDGHGDSYPRDAFMATSNVLTAASRSHQVRVLECACCERRAPRTSSAVDRRRSGGCWSALWRGYFPVASKWIALHSDGPRCRATASSQDPAGHSRWRRQRGSPKTVTRSFLCCRWRCVDQNGQGCPGLRRAVWRARRAELGREPNRAGLRDGISVEDVIVLRATFQGLTKDTQQNGT